VPGLLPDRLKTMFRVSGATALKPNTPSSSHSRGNEKEVTSTRQSRGLEQFFGYINDQVGLSILDLAGVTQENVSYVTDLGHKITTQDFLRSLDDTFGREEIGEQSSASRIEYFLEQNLDFKEHSFDGVLIWDVMQYLSPALLNATIERLFTIVRPRSYMLAFFNADEKSLVSPNTSFRIQDKSTLLLAQRGLRKQAQVFNNRSLEKLFGQFESVKFFLTREHLREVIIKR
jgi:hypothetical protein